MGIELNNVPPLLDITVTRENSFNIDGKQLNAKFISCQGVPLPFPLIGEGVISKDRLTKIGKIVQKLIAIIHSRNNSTDLLGALKAKIGIGGEFRATGKGNNAKIVSGGSFDGTGGTIHLTNDALLTLFGYPLTKDENGNYTEAQKIKAQINPELENQRFIGIFTEWLMQITAQK